MDNAAQDERKATFKNSFVSKEMLLKSAARTGKRAGEYAQKGQPAAARVIAEEAAHLARKAKPELKSEDAAVPNLQVTDAGEYGQAMGNWLGATDLRGARDAWGEEAQKLTRKSPSHEEGKQAQGPLTKAQTEFSKKTPGPDNPKLEKFRRRVAIANHPENDAAQDAWGEGDKTATGPLTKAQNAHGEGAKAAGRTEIGGKRSETMQRRIAIAEHPENDAARDAEMQDDKEHAAFYGGVAAEMAKRPKQAWKKGVTNAQKAEYAGHYAQLAAHEANLPEKIKSNK